MDNIITKINGYTYDLTDWANEHPGGKKIIQSLNNNENAYITIFSNHDRFHHEKIRKILECYKVKSDKYSKTSFHQYMENKPILSKMSVVNLLRNTTIDKYDLVFYTSLMIYLCNISLLTNIISLVILGGYGHQYIHTMSKKGCVIVLAGFNASKWGHDHVLSHHIYTNLSGDTDLTDFNIINKIPLYPALRFILVTIYMLLRSYVEMPVMALFKSVKFDVLEWLCYLYNLYDLVFNFGISLLVKRLTVNAWFLYIDYFNHYYNVPKYTKLDNWYDHQISTSRNIVVSTWLYENYPFIHSLLTFGLDRQIEHHVHPQLPMEHLSKLDLSGNLYYKTTLLNYASFMSFLRNFPN